MSKGFAGSNTDPDVKDELETPPEVFERVQDLLGVFFSWDVCANDNNSKCPDYIKKSEENSLELDWHQDFDGCHVPGQKTVALWMNPPYSNPLPWCEKAAQESKKGVIIVGLLPDDRSCKWYREFIDKEASLCLIPDKRINFINPLTKQVMKGNNRGPVFPVWTPWRTDTTAYQRFTLSPIVGYH